jgi:hypothetical protein
VSRRVEVGWTHPETEEDFRVECSVGPGQPEIRWGESAQPALAGEVEILRVTEDAPGGVERPDLIAAVEADWDLIEERALETACEDEESEYEAAMDLKADCERDARRFGW